MLFQSQIFLENILTWMWFIPIQISLASRITVKVSSWILFAKIGSFRFPPGTHYTIRKHNLQLRNLHHNTHRVLGFGANTKNRTYILVILEIPEIGERSRTVISHLTVLASLKNAATACLSFEFMFNCFTTQSTFLQFALYTTPKAPVRVNT